jgi:hypothetical protein
LLELTEEDEWLVDVAGSIIGSVEEELAEQVSAPLDTMLNLVGEVSQCAHWDSFFRGILRVTVALGLVWDNHL